MTDRQSITAKLDALEREVCAIIGTPSNSVQGDVLALIAIARAAAGLLAGFAEWGAMRRGPVGAVGPCCEFCGEFKCQGHARDCLYAGVREKLDALP